MSCDSGHGVRNVIVPVGRMVDAVFPAARRATLQSGKLVHWFTRRGLSTNRIVRLLKQALLARIKPLKRRTPPIDLAEAKPKAQWVEPSILVDVEYRARTGKSGLLRHPTYKGTRRDLIT
jgi:bifunctional non-homologous end joining protein LigD